jgi:predicted phosphate transport protein (TIGR00153 family)
MGISLMPKEKRFFELFARQGDLLAKMAKSFEGMMTDYSKAEAFALEIRELEHQGDQITHEIFDRLNTSFVTPFDPEDIHALASAMDDVLDEIEGVAARFLMFHVKAPTPTAVQLSRVLVGSADALRAAVLGLEQLRRRGRDAIVPHIIEVNNRESEADELTRQAVSDLFKGGMEVLDVIRWKELYARLEHAADRAEDVGNILENICVKHA